MAKESDVNMFKEGMNPDTVLFVFIAFKNFSFEIFLSLREVSRIT